MTNHRDMVSEAMRLHEEFPVESAFLVEFINIIIHSVKTNFMYNKANWKRESRGIDFEVWAAFMDTVSARIKEHRGGLKKDSKAFGRLLFGDQSRIFTLHCLYTLAEAVPENDRFNNKVIELFS